MILQAEPLNAAAFSPFGAVIGADPATAIEINEGFTTRFHRLAAADCDGKTILSIFRGRVRPLQVLMLERHPLGSQAFMPLGGHPWLTVVALSPEPAACRLFACRGDQGLQIAKGVWHHPLLVLEGAQDFLVVDRDSDGDNLEEVFFENPVSLAV